MNRKRQAAYNKAYKIEFNQAIFKDAGTCSYYAHFHSMDEYEEFKTSPEIYSEINHEKLIATRKKAASRAAKPNDGILHQIPAESGDPQMTHIIEVVNKDSKLAASFKTFTGLQPISDLRDSMDEAEHNVTAYIERVGQKKLRGRYVTEPYAYRTGVLKAIGRAGFVASAAELVFKAGVKAGIWVVEKEKHGTGEYEEQTIKYRVGIVGHSSEKRRSALRHWDWELRSEQDDYYNSHDKKGNYVELHKRW